MIKIEVSTEKSNRENSWLELGNMVDGKWVYGIPRYPQDSKKLVVSRKYWNTANGNGKESGTDWSIEIPEGYKLSIAKISMHRTGRNVNVIFEGSK